MQLVIEIPEYYYKAIKEIPVEQSTADMLIIRYGTPLPKGHGDLIDRSKLVPDCNELEIHDGDDWRNEYCGVSLMQIEQYAEVVVKADGGDTE